MIREILKFVLNENCHWKYDPTEKTTICYPLTCENNIPLKGSGLVFTNVLQIWVGKPDKTMTMTPCELYYYNYIIIDLGVILIFT